MSCQPRCHRSWRIPSPASGLAAFRRTYVAALWIAVLVAVAPDVAPSILIPQSSELEFRIRAEEGLEGIARSIVTDPGASAEFPGIGSPGVWIRDTVDLILLRDLNTLQEAGFGPPERWVAGLAAPEGLRIALRAGRELETLATDRPRLQAMAEAARGVARPEATDAVVAACLRAAGLTADRGWVA